MLPEKKSRTDEFLKDYKKALFRLSLPSLIAFGITTLYNTVDTIFVGGLGYEAIAALTFAFPVFFFLFAIAMGLGVGFTATIAMAIGAKDKKRADNAAEHAMLLSLLMGVVIGILGWLFCADIFAFLGAEGRTLELSVEYFSIIFITLVILYGAVFARAILAGEGDMETPMKVMVGASILNIILDPIMIYWMNMGIAGAAWATVMANLLALAVYVHFLLSRKGSYIDLDLKDFRFNPSIFAQSLVIGIPAMLAQGMMSVGAAVVNFLVAPFGAIAVAGFGIGLRVDFFALMPIIAVGSALTTLAGIYTGAKRPGLLKNALFYGIKACVAMMVVIGIPVYLFAEQLISIFTSEAEVIAIGSQYLRIIVFTYPLIAMAMNIGRTLTGVGRSLEGLLITSVRVVVVFLPAVFYFTRVLGMGLEGIWYAVLCASTCATLTAVALLYRFLSKSKGPPKPLKISPIK